jgi:uncharacterized membrane protein
MSLALNLHTVFSGLVAIEHLYIWFLESFLWGTKKFNVTFGIRREEAETLKKSNLDQMYVLYLPLELPSCSPCFSSATGNKDYVCVCKFVREDAKAMKRSDSTKALSPRVLHSSFSPLLPLPFHLSSLSFHPLPLPSTLLLMLYRVKTLFINQGWYNLVLAVGLFWGLFHSSPEFGLELRKFFLGAVFSCAVVGGISTGKLKILGVQGIPALVGLVAAFMGW